jgi:hypothetical protein
MRMSPILVLSLLGLPLGGCFGVTLPPRPLPDWAMNPQTQYVERRVDPAPGAPRRKQPIVRQRANDLTAANNELVTGGTGGDLQPDARPVETAPSALGWDTREDERDPSLRRTLNICRGC